jgi:hypothetical protein
MSVTKQEGKWQVKMRLLLCLSYLVRKSFPETVQQNSSQILARTRSDASYYFSRLLSLSWFIPWYQVHRHPNSVILAGKKGQSLGCSHMLSSCLSNVKVFDTMFKHHYISFVNKGLWWHFLCGLHRLFKLLCYFDIGYNSWASLAARVFC